MKVALYTLLAVIIIAAIAFALVEIFFGLMRMM